MSDRIAPVFSELLLLDSLPNSSIVSSSAIVISISTLLLASLPVRHSSSDSIECYLLIGVNFCGVIPAQIEQIQRYTLASALCEGMDNAMLMQELALLQPWGEEGPEYDDLPFSLPFLMSA